ncbi:MAG: hypothetical protein ABIG66_03560 [Candidatus Kerfeldbacteria bacterium]
MTQIHDWNILSRSKPKGLSIGKNAPTTEDKKMKRNIIGLVVATVIFAISTSAVAGEELPKPSAVVNLGTNATILLPTGEAIGGYVAVGPSLLIPVRGPFSIIPGAQFEVAPELGNWGFLGSMVFDFLLTDWFALDATVMIIHDVDPVLRAERGRGATAYFSVGGGPTFILPNGLSISPFCLATVSLEGFGWALNPGIALGIPLP